MLDGFNAWILILLIVTIVVVDTNARDGLNEWKLIMLMVKNFLVVTNA